MSISGDEIDTRVGLRVRDLRTARSLTLDALARAANVSKAMLSRIEHGDSSPTAQLLNRICGALGISLSELFADMDRPPGPLMRRDEQPVWRDPASHYLRRNVSPPATGSAVDITEIEFPPAASVAFDNDHVAASDQHVWILAGTLEITVGDQPFRLQTGDCLMMRFNQPVLFHNPTDESTRYAVVISRAGSRR